MTGTNIGDLLLRLQDGNEAAAQKLFDQYSRRLTALAEKHLSDRLSQRIDGEDIVQSVFRTFFQRSQRGEFQVNSTVDLWQLLVTITLAKVRSQARRHAAGKRSIDAEAGDIEGYLSQAISAEPSPEEAVMLVDQIETVLDGLPATYAEILMRRLQGQSRGEIAAELQISRQTVYRALALLRSQLEQSDIEDDTPGSHTADKSLEP